MSAEDSGVASVPTTNVPVAGARSRKKRMLQLALPILLGAVLGYGYHRIVGCRTGACPITANPYISTIYGAVMGFLFAGGGR